MEREPETFFERLKNSAAEFQNIRTIVMCGLLAALGIVLRLYVSIDITKNIRIGFSELPNVVTAYLFGPVVGSIFAGVVDILKFIIKPTDAFLPLFTLNAAAKGFVFGIGFYKKKITWLRIFVVQLIAKIIFGILLYTLFYGISFGAGAAMGALMERVIQNLISLPIDTVIDFAVFKGLQQIFAQMGLAQIK